MFDCLTCLLIQGGGRREAARGGEGGEGEGEDNGGGDGGDLGAALVGEGVGGGGGVCVEVGGEAVLRRQPTSRTKK